MTDSIVWLHELDPAPATSVAGAKMGRLSELFRLGINVPRGFTTTVDAYRRHCATSGLDSFVEHQLSTLAGMANDVRLATVADTIRARFEETPLEPTLAARIRDAYAELSFRCAAINQPVAVRSSAAGEDSTQASFAGVYDTYLGLSGEPRVLAAVQRCWASLFSARALSYPIGRGVSHHDMPMAVGVLELVHARVSGVAFSLHPVTGRPDRMVIEGTWGWSEAVVQGAVTPDHIEVDKADRRVLIHDVADKKVVSVFDYTRGEVIETETPPRFRNVPILDEEEIGAVADAVCGIENHYGYPVDIERVIGPTRRPGEQVCVVQVRPITVAGGRKSEAGMASWDPGAYAAKYLSGGR